MSFVYGSLCFSTNPVIVSKQFLLAFVQRNAAKKGLEGSQKSQIILKEIHPVTWLHVFIAELRRPEGPPSGAPYLSRESKGNP